MSYYYIDQGDYMSLYYQLQHNYEIGGELVLNGNRLIPRYGNSGGHDSISLNEGSQFLFHTHPGKCLSKQDCSFGMPSSQDMAQMLTSAEKGNVAHFVVANEGLYVVQVKCSLLAAYTKNPSEIKDEIKNRFKSFQNSFSTENIDYNSFIYNWISFANSLGFHVFFFEHGSAITLSLQNKCF